LLRERPSPKKNAGRPKKTPNQTKGDYLELRLTPPEKQGFKDAAEIAGIPLAAWVRERLRRAAVRELEEADRPIPFLSFASRE
jgi:uncharacterized protein (DUF1778 family)